jgi:heme/copper-type cytochrome/quinol oxidase subunit 2
MSKPLLRMKLKNAAVVIGATAFCGLVATIMSWQRTAPTARNFEIKARQYAYEPPKIHVNSGDTLSIRLASLDVVHGFFLEGHDLDAEIHPQKKRFLVRHPSRDEEWREVEEMSFVVGAPGKYRYRCSHTCGTMHPFMMGEMIVAPNLPLHAGIGSLIGLFLGMSITAFTGTKLSESNEKNEIEENDATQV